MNRQLSISTTILAALLFLSAGCGNSPALPPDLSGEGTTDGGATETAHSEIAEDWNELTIGDNHSNPRGDATISQNGHFFIRVNNCWVSGAGALPLEAWNRLAKAVNLGVKAELATEPVCFPVPEQYASTYNVLNDKIKVKLNNGGMRELLDASGAATLCSRIKDVSIARELFIAGQNAMTIAKREDATCGGW